MAEALSIHRANAAARSSRPAVNVPGWSALVGGGALAVLGLTRRSKAGLALAAGGGLLAYAGARATARREPLIASSTMQVNCSPDGAKAA